MKSWIWAVVALAAFFFGGWLLGRHFAQPEVVETTRIEKVFYERPQPIASSDIEVKVNVPKFIFAPADTVDRLVIVGDSVKMTITERTLEYRDSTYYARVVGPVIGSMSPRLDFIETYNTTTTTTQLLKQPRNTFTLSANAGVDYARAGWSPFAEVGFTIDFKAVTLTATAGVDNVFKSPAPRVGAEIGVPLWRR